MQPWKLLECNYAHIKQQSYEVAVLPLGATEPHNLHLPYGADVFEADLVGEKICEAAHQPRRQGGAAADDSLRHRDQPAAVPAGHEPESLDAACRGDRSGRVACRSGIRKIVLLNSHGGNDLKPLLRQLYGKTPATLFLCNWYQIFADVYQDIFDEPDDHAGEMETSLHLAFLPHLVGRTEDGRLLADAGAKAETRFEAVHRGWVSITRPWHLLTTNAGAGNPHAATAEKGSRLMDVLVERLAAFLVELSESELDERFPFY